MFLHTVTEYMQSNEDKKCGQFTRQRIHTNKDRLVNTK